MSYKIEDTFKKIMHETGKQPSVCSCELCKKQCLTCPCLATPDEVERIIDAGHGDKIFPTDWLVGVMLGLTNDSILMFQAEQTPTGCVFFKDGLCSIHDIKPTEGRLSHHSHSVEEAMRYPEKTISWNVAKEWLKVKNIPTIIRIAEKLKIAK